MTVREASYSQADAIFELYEQSRAAYRSLLINKWNDGRPDFDDVFGHIDDGICYAAEQDGRVAAAFVLDFSDDTAYRASFSCNWPQGEYAVLHRLTVNDAFKKDEVMQSVVDFCISRCTENGVGIIRCGAHPKDETACRLLEQLGFEPCGRLRTPTGEERTAYFMNLDKNN